MINDSDILELKFEGNGINPGKVKPSEIASLIEDFEKILLITIKQKYPEIDTTQVLFTFDSVKNESLGIKFTPKDIRPNGLVVKDVVLSAFFFFTTAVQENNFKELDNDALTPLRSINKFSRKYECPAKFIYNQEELVAISPDTEIKLNKSITLKGDTTIFGELIDSGGDNPNIHLKVNNDYIIIIDTDRQKAKDLGSRLYEFVGLKGIAKWEVDTSKIIEFKLQDVLEFKGGNTSKALTQLKNESSGFWDTLNTNDDINNHLIRDSL